MNAWKIHVNKRVFILSCWFYGDKRKAVSSSAQRTLWKQAGLLNITNHCALKIYHNIMTTTFRDVIYLFKLKNPLFVNCAVCHFLGFSTTSQKSLSGEGANAKNGPHISSTVSFKTVERQEHLDIFGSQLHAQTSHLKNLSLLLKDVFGRNV